jgi:hypothetical protein
LDHNFIRTIAAAGANMDAEKAFLVIGLTLILVIVFNLAIYISVKRRGENPAGQKKMLSKVFKRARDPWEKDKERLKELSDIVSGLQNNSPSRENKDNH